MKNWIIKKLGGYTLEEYLQVMLQYKDVHKKTLDILEQVVYKPEDSNKPPDEDLLPVNTRRTPWSVRSKMLEDRAKTLKKEIDIEAQKKIDYYTSLGGELVK